MEMNVYSEEAKHSEMVTSNTWCQGAGGALDYVITNAVVLDPVIGIVRGDIGIKDGKIAGIGKAGNPLIMDGVDRNLIVSACTEATAGEHPISTQDILIPISHDFLLACIRWD